MGKHTKAPGSQAKRSRLDWPLVVYVWIIGLGLFSYLFGRIAFDALPHPVHWTSGVAGAILGYFVGQLWYRWRGDIL